MKRMIRTVAEPEVIGIRVDVYYAAETEDIVATDVHPIQDAEGHIDPQALADYHAFIQNAWNVIEYYGFEMFKMKTSKSAPGTSKYAWVAHATEVGKNDTPLIVRLRISDHEQHFADEHLAKIKRHNKEEAEELKRPESKQKQRFFVEDIIVNNERYKTYEDALNAIDKIVHDWLERMHIDMSDFEDLGKW